MRRLFLWSIVSLLIAALAACHSADEGEPVRARDQLKKLSNAKDMDEAEETAATDDEEDVQEEGESESEAPPQVDQTREVVPSEVQGLEIVLASRPSGTDAPPDVLVYAILLDERGHQISAAGDLDITVSTLGSEDVQKSVPLIPKRFVEQDIPGQNQNAFSAFIDVIRLEDAGTVSVKASFDNRLQSEKTISVDRVPPPAKLN